MGKYSGFPMLYGRVKNSDFQYILNRINSRLAGWKMKLFSRAAQLILAQSILTSMPIYTMQNVGVPEGICEKKDSTICKFVWGGNHSPWVNKSIMSRPRKEGGLNIHPTHMVNTSLLGKHI